MVHWTHAGVFFQTQGGIPPTFLHFTTTRARNTWCGKMMTRSLQKFSKGEHPHHTFKKKPHRGGNYDRVRFENVPRTERSEVWTDFFFFVEQWTMEGGNTDLKTGTLMRFPSFT